MDSINVILNSNDVSEYLKISPNGLEVIGLFKDPYTKPIELIWQILNYLALAQQELGRT